MNTRHHLVVGLHDSGKTTFIAALWHVVISGEIGSALQLHALDGDRTHLNRIREAWLRCDPVPRTSQQAEAHVRMLLMDADNRVSEVWFPDMSGESFRDQWVDRHWSAAYDKLVEQADSVLIFVHPERIVEPLRIAVVNALAGGIADPQSSSSQPVPVTPRPWDAKQAATQVQLVELLQLLQWRKPGQGWAISMIVSAWDLIRGLGQTPHVWCRARLPLLDQFLRANTNSFRVRYCGVSAQGGALPGEAGRLRAIECASERIQVVLDNLAPTSDITAILRHTPQEVGT